LTDDMPLDVQPDRLPRPGGHSIAYHRQMGKSPALLFCGGFKSDMTGAKAAMLADRCRRAGRGFVRFDYFGHGQSSGEFAAGTVGRWADDAIAVLDNVCQGPQVIVGSSMGGWIMLLAALARPARVAGLAGVAAAPDFTEALMWERMPANVRQTLETEGVWRQPSAYDPEPYPITMSLIAEGRRHLLLDRPIPLTCPVRLLHGMKDEDVPWRHGVRLVEALAGGDVTLTLIKDGDHRLSRPEDLDRLWATAEGLCEAVAGQ
jgi:pimeloyl-ACP methyl ester carboxylesterase